MGGKVKVIGLMSGTSLDGIDAALLETDGENEAHPGAALTIPYGADMRRLLRAALEEAARAKPGETPAIVIEAEAQLTEAHALAVKQLLDQARLRPADIAMIGFHGQTVLHRPEERRTWQIGDGATLAKRTAIAVVNDFRTKDVASGGQGAPFVPLYHRVLARDLPKPLAVLNIGGVANVTYLDAEGGLHAFDTGPGNALIDDWAMKHTGESMDREGALAKVGSIDEAALAELLAHAFFDQPPPKSLDRLDFTAAAVADLMPADGAATLTAFTAAGIARANAHFAESPTQWIVCGGGRHNPVLMQMLKNRLEAPVLSAEDAGWRGDFIEAEAFAYLAMRSAKGLPLSLPTTTGVPAPMTGGRLHRAA
jgi:anhydro-N-acetylmuramic acid kinase